MASCKHTREKYKSLKFSFQQKLASTTEARQHSSIAKTLSTANHKACSCEHYTLGELALSAEYTGKCRISDFKYPV